MVIFNATFLRKNVLQEFAIVLKKWAILLPRFCFFMILFWLQKLRNVSLCCRWWKDKGAWKVVPWSTDLKSASPQVFLYNARLITVARYKYEKELSEMLQTHCPRFFYFSFLFPSKCLSKKKSPFRNLYKFNNSHYILTVRDQFSWLRYGLQLWFIWRCVRDSDGESFDVEVLYYKK